MVSCCIYTQSFAPCSVTFQEWFEFFEVENIAKAPQNYTKLYPDQHGIGVDQRDDADEAFEYTSRAAKLNNRLAIKNYGAK